MSFPVAGEMLYDSPSQFGFLSVGIPAYDKFLAASPTCGLDFSKRNPFSFKLWLEFTGLGNISFVLSIRPHLYVLQFQWLLPKTILINYSSLSSWFISKHLIERNRH